MVVISQHANLGICKQKCSIFSVAENWGSRYQGQGLSTVCGWLPGPLTLSRIEPPRSVVSCSQNPQTKMSVKENLRWLFLQNLVFNKQILEESRTTNLDDILEVKLSSKCLITSPTVGYSASNGTFAWIRVHIFRQPFPLLSISSYHQALPFIVSKPLIQALE